ncbi:MAG: LysM peptidoglycan-binding domain-containing protein [Deltaproteobacteria bacterium]|nr:LysM peptidoglycan-binding domain-containing protein [Deltaproteobacteria bacterium]
MKEYRYVSMLVIGILSFWLNGCAHQSQGFSSAQPGTSNLDSPKIACDPVFGRRSPASYRISEDAELDDLADVDAAENDDKQGDRINFGIKNQNILDEALDFCQLAQDYWLKGQLENAISALDQAYALIIKVDTFNRPRLIQQKEDLRYLITRRIQDIYGSRNVVAKGSLNAIPMVMNDYVKAEIESLTTGCEKDFFINAYQRSGRYRKYIEAELAKEGLPLELAWLPLIESGYNVKALSPARALGLWQFIPSTGYRFGLSRDKYVDERLDPYKSTKAAILYLKELHHLFGDWETVLAAYNCGEGRVLRTINMQSINYLDNFWDLYEKLPRETARYVPRFQATLHIIQNPKQYGLTDIHPEPPLEFETVSVSRQLQLKSIANSTGIEESTLKRLNPELRYGIIPGDNYPFKIPQGASDMLLSQLDDIPETNGLTPEDVAQEKPASHKVKRGETLASLAKLYQTSQQNIIQANKLKKSAKIKPGMVLLVPPPKPPSSPAKASSTLAKAQPSSTKASSTLAKAPSPSAKESPAPAKHAMAKKPVPVRVVTHVVKSGDSLFNIANRYGVTTKRIQEVNKLTSFNIAIGQSLTIPEPTKTAAVETGLKKYMVKKGENAFTIASSHNMPIDRFLSINNLSSGSKIFPGQKVYVE